MAEFSRATNFDPLIHQLSHHAIMAVLAGRERADFTDLVEAARLNKGTRSKHLTKLSDAGVVRIEKGFKGNYPNTTASLSPAGSKAFQEYRRQYKRINRLIEEGAE